MSRREEWEVREERTNRVLGTYSAAATRPKRGDVIELDGQPFEIRQVADIVIGDGKTQHGWLIVSS